LKRAISLRGSSSGDGLAIAQALLPLAGWLE
jgi:hypothetical protein